MADFQSLPGFREFYPEDCALRNHIFRLWRQSGTASGFDEYDAPALEPLELYTEKSGEEIRKQLFEFEDKGGRMVALRPEMTPSLARLVGAKASALRRPVKWFSIGECFRYERKQKGRLRSFYQFNADILGEAGVEADAEIIALAVQTLQRFGLGDSDFVIRVSDRDLWILFLQACGVPQDAVMPVLGVVDKTERMPAEAATEALQEVLGGNSVLATALFAELTSLKEIRSVEELRAFLGRKNLPVTLTPQLEKRLADWTALFSLFDGMGIRSFVRMDFAIVRGLAYYTGFVFEVFQTFGQARALAGGGRYDNLVAKLGGPQLPATGFAMGDVTLGDLLEEKQILPKFNFAPQFFMVRFSQAESPAMLHDAFLLRSAGLRTDYALREAAVGKQMKAAAQSASDFALIYAPAELAENKVRLRDMRTQKEMLLPRDTNLLSHLLDIRENGFPETTCANESATL